MKIVDLVENVITETDEQLLQKLLDRFRKTTGEFNNASHKFYTVRKALANELEGDEQEAVKKASPGEFFTYLKSQKANKTTASKAPSEPSKPEPIQSPKQDLELRGVTQKELDEAGTVFAIIQKWVDMFHPKYSAEEITDSLYNSAMGNFEEKPYIHKEVTNAIIKSQTRNKEQEEAELKPRMEKLFKISASEVNDLKGTDIYTDVLNDMVTMVKNQPRTPGQKPQPAYKMYGYIRDTLYRQYNRNALESFKQGNTDSTSEYMKKRSIIKSISSTEFRNWYSSNA